MKERDKRIAVMLCLGLAVALLLWTATAGALEPDEKCQVAKNTAAGKLAFCLQNAEMKVVKTKGHCSVATTAECYRDGDCPLAEVCVKDLTKYNSAVTKCGTKFLKKWAKEETKAADKGGSCPDGIADPNPMLGFVSSHSDAVALALAGGGLPTCGDDTINMAGEQCDGTDLGGESCVSLGFDAGTLACASCAFDTSSCTRVAFPGSGQAAYFGVGSDGDVQAGAALSYTDNGDGTITDNNTGLMWEKKDDSGGIHDWNNSYIWGLTNSMQGTIKSVFLDGLNDVTGGGAHCFAGYCDWRIPNVKELHSIVNYNKLHPVVSTVFNKGCATGCTVDGVSGPMCSCTGSKDYWSSTTYAYSPYKAFYVDFFGGLVGVENKDGSRAVRAVRGGL